MYLFVAVVVTAVVIWLAWRGLGGRPDAASPPRPIRPTRPPMRQIAPDDDPEFLGELERKLREDNNGSPGSPSAT